MPTVTASLGTIEGAEVSVTYDTKTGVLEQVITGNPLGKALHIVIQTDTGETYELKTNSSDTVTVPEPRPKFKLTRGVPTGITVTLVVCDHPAAH